MANLSVVKVQWSLFTSWFTRTFPMKFIYKAPPLLKADSVVYFFDVVVTSTLVLFDDAMSGHGGHQNGSEHKRMWIC